MLLRSYEAVSAVEAAPAGHCADYIYVEGRRRVRVLLTGGTGFVGKALADALKAGGHDVRLAVRNPLGSIGIGFFFQYPGLEANVDWRPGLAGMDVVIHLAGLAHVTDIVVGYDASSFRRVNTEATIRLAEQSAESGVKRFIFLSSIKAMGEGSELGHPLSADDPLRPVDAYGISKQEAEQALVRLAGRSAMEVVVIRPVLVYGPGVGANFLSMMRWLDRGVPLPLGAVHNKRSLVALDNLVALILTCLDHPAAANQTFHVSDGEDLSTTDLLRRMGRALGKPAPLLPVPAWLLWLVASMFGKQDAARRLCGSLQVDIGKTRELLGWSPPVCVDEGLRRAAEAFLAQQKVV